LHLNKTITFSATLIALFVIAPLAAFAGALIVTTQDVTNINERSATINGRIASDPTFWWSIRKVDEYGIYWNTTGNLNTNSDERSNRGDADLPFDFSMEIENLQPGTTYYAWAYADPPFFSPVYGNRISFTTLQRPEVGTLPVTDIGSTTATGNGTLSILGIPAAIQHGLCWDTKKNPTIDDEKTEEGTPKANGPFTAKLTGLKTDKKYYVRAYATNLAGTVYGKQKSFRTLSGFPVVSAPSVTHITTTSATVEATLVDIGDPPATQYGVCWDTDSMPEYTPENCLHTGETIAEGSVFTIQINGLQTGTTYYLRAFATNAAQTHYYGNEISFTTYALTVVSTQSVSGTNTNEVTANGTIDSLGNPVPTAYGFCWNMAGSPTIVDECVDLALPVTTGPFVATLADLVPGATYFVRAFATNQAGTGYGEDLSFTTIAETAAPRAVVMNPPASLTRQTTYQLTVAGSRVVAYSYSFDGQTWSEPVTTGGELSFEIIDEGPHWLHLLGMDENGVWQARQSATVVTWTLDTTPPKAEMTNAPAGTIGPFTADILVAGNGLVAYRYRLENDGTWSAIFPASVPIKLPKLQIGPHTLAVVGADLAGNWQDDEDATTIEWHVDANVPTALLTNLPKAVTNQTSVSIGVATPKGGESVKEYYYRFDDSDDWTFGTISQTIDQSWPQGGEGKHTLCVNAGNGQGVWQDGSDGQSSIDNATCYTWAIDLTPPVAVQLLGEKAPPAYVQEGLAIGSRAVKLSWTWQSDNDQTAGDHQVAIQRYRVWQSEQEIREDNLDQAVELFYASQPGPEGHMESFSINGLAGGKTHYFAVKAIDRAGNSSVLSNVESIFLADNVPEIIEMAFEDGGVQADNASAKKLSLVGNSFMKGQDSNYVRFENSDAGFMLAGTLVSDVNLVVQIPLGIPSDIYWIRVVNAKGISSPGPEMITIVDAENPLPAVRNISPRMAPIGTPIDLTITGDHFEPNSGVSLVAMDGQEFHLPVYDISVQKDGRTLTATVDVPADLPEGLYDIRVTNMESAFNQLSAVRLELYIPQSLDETSGGVETHKIVQLTDGIVPIFTTLKTRDDILVGETGNFRTKLKVFLMPGLTFEVQQFGQNEALPFHGHLLSPRETEAAGTVIDTLGAEAVQLFMGADVTLHLKNDAVMFATLDIILPSHLQKPTVYYLAPDNGLEPAGVQGTWQGIDIEKGGTILSARPNTPASGLTTYSLGILLDHFSEYAVGFSTNTNAGNSDIIQAIDSYGPCFIGTAR
jgi:hypothetical protein